MISRMITLVAGAYVLGIAVGTTVHMVDRFAFDWSLGTTFVHGVLGSLDWPLRLLG